MSNLLLVKPEKLDKIQKPIDEAKYFQWKETLLDCANQKPDWSDLHITLFYLRNLPFKAWSKSGEMLLLLFLLLLFLSLFLLLLLLFWRLLQKAVQLASAPGAARLV